MTTIATFYPDPTNIDYLIPSVRISFGDLDGTTFSDTIVRTSIINAVSFLQPKWYSKYQVYKTSLNVVPQPEDTPAGYIAINGYNGIQYVPDTIIDGDVFRSAYIEFTQVGNLFETADEYAVILAATYILRRIQLTSSLNDFVSWTTEDIRYSNLGSERSISKLLEMDLEALNSWFGKGLGKPRMLNFAPAYIPGFSSL